MWAFISKKRKITIKTGYQFGQIAVEPRRFHCLMRAYFGLHGADYEMTSECQSEKILRELRVQERHLLEEIEKEFILYTSALGELLRGATLVTNNGFGSEVDPSRFISLMWVFIGINTKDTILKRMIFRDSKNTLQNLGVSREDFPLVLESSYYLYTDALGSLFNNLDVVI